VAARIGAGAPGPLRLAHRGDSRVAPENSLQALVAAMRIPGCDGVEFDVRLSRDGVPVLLHDETLRRVQHRRGRVEELDARELAPAGIPALGTVLDVLPADAFLDVELKGDAHGAATVSVLRAARGESPTRAVVSSFEGATLAAVRDLLPGWSRWLISEDLGPATLSLALGLGCSAVAVLWGSITAASLGRTRDAGIDVVAWTVRRRATVERLGRLGVIACCVEGQALGPSL
jgi:glycerophosphoryl diester phosphodiesterase